MTSSFAPQRDGARTALEVSFERRTDPETGGLSTADCAWPGRLRRIVRAGLTYWRRPDLVEDAELLLTELVTNALRHGRGDDIAARVYLQGRQCVIEVDDDSPGQPEPQNVDPEDESGRGLLLVVTLAEDWGVRANGRGGTTTWCTLPLSPAEGLPQMQPVASTAPVQHEMELGLPADFKAVPGARINGRAALTVLKWHGNVPAAIDVLHCLVDNAVRHGLTPGRRNESIGAWLRVTEAHELILDVTDPNTAFPDAENVLAGKAEGSLGDVAQVAVLSWSPHADGTGKTVRAVLRPGQVEL